ncbi:MAG TPA: molybdate ABC transporter substrate-binding protein [Nocardioidaceae bacterium]|nr:molybdate ABC transporter substrate-binding protein [Nocardioidaceae bacterium]
MRPAGQAGPAGVAGMAAAAVLTACGGPGPAGASDDGRAGPVNGEVVVFAASSLTGSFQRIGRAFEAAHPGVEVRFSFGGSSSLGPQVAAGAPADVFASADRATMARAVAADATAARPVLFARNRLQVAVPPDNPGRVDGLDDFARSELTLAVCAPQVPCGAAARRAFAAAGVRARPDTLEQDVKAVLTKVELGEVDAGLVYRTDVRAAGERVRGVAVPEVRRVVNAYPIAPLADAPNPAGGRAFVRFVRSATGREVLVDAGFDLP